MSFFWRKIIIFCVKETNTHTRAQRVFEMKFLADKCQSCLHVIFANVLRQPLSKWCRLFSCFCFVRHRLPNDICATQSEHENVEHITMNNEQIVVWSSKQTSARDTKQVVNKLWIECEWNVEMGNNWAKNLCFKVIHKVERNRKCRSKRTMITKPFNVINILQAPNPKKYSTRIVKSTLRQHLMTMFIIMKQFCVPYRASTHAKMKLKLEIFKDKYFTSWRFHCYHPL